MLDDEQQLGLVKLKISHDVVEALEALLTGAKSGAITGIAFVATLKRMRYITDTAGVCYKNPTYTRGMVTVLADELGAMIHGRDADETR